MEPEQYLSMDTTRQQEMSPPQPQPQPLATQLDHQQTNLPETSIKTESAADGSSGQKDTADTKKKRAGPKRRKVTHACVYCRRSHMTCDDGRPCQRCIKRSIGHLCHDEPKTTHSPQQIVSNNTPLPASLVPLPSVVPDAFSQIAAFSQLQFASAQMGNEYTVIRLLSSDFLENIDGEQQNYQPQDGSVLNEKFLLTAADPSDGPSEARLHQVIHAKFEAGILKPYNYVKGYARLQQYMENNMSNINRQRILNSLSTFRPAFRAVAQSLMDIDLVMVEEEFEQLLLNYDRVFSSIGIPACLWRRTGEIYKGNKEFASLVRVPIDSLKEGRLCIYEMMAEESAVNYWEKYGNIAFDAGQKAVLTSCLLRSPSRDNQNVISCCFSFTIRRDKYNIPSAIVGNFLPIQLST